MHPVQFGKTRKPITNTHFKGVFKDYIVWPTSTRGVPISIQIVIKTAHASIFETFPVVPRS
jgi:hypothetical protein